VRWKRVRWAHSSTMAGTTCRCRSGMVVIRIERVGGLGLSLSTKDQSSPNGAYLDGAGPRADDGHALALEAAGVVPAGRVEGRAREVLDACGLCVCACLGGKGSETFCSYKKVNRYICKRHRSNACMHRALLTLDDGVDRDGEAKEAGDEEARVQRLGHARHWCG
jgi:hypothetical protein